MKMKTTILTALAAILLIGCGNDNNKTTTTADSGAKLEGNLIVDKPTEFTVFSIHQGKAFEGDLPVFKKAGEMTNVKLKGIASKNQTNQVQAYNLMLSSGDLPDILAYELVEDLERLGTEGGLIPLEELIDKHGPNIKKFWEENPRYKKDAVAANGHIYMIPNYNDYFNLKASQGYYIRKDWLNKLGLKEPQTIDELYEVLVAFKTKDPNGNGKADEIPFFTRGDIPRKILLSLLDVFQVSPVWTLDKNGQVIYGPAQDQYKVAMQEISKWYKEGLIDPEVFTRGLSSRDYMLNNDLGGFTNDWFASTASYNKKLENIIPGFDFAPMLPVEYNGERKTLISRPTYMGGWGITVSAKNPVAIVKYFDFWYSPEGRNMWNFGIENKEWEMKDGKPHFTDYVLKNPDGKNPLTVIKESGAQFRMGMFQDANYELQWTEPAALDALELYTKNNAIADGLPILKYTKDEIKELNKIETQMRNYTEEMGQKWIMGVSDVNTDWNAYTKRLSELGLARAQEIQKQAYDRFMNN